MKQSSQIDITCLNCNVVFKVRKYRKDTAKYCSRSCGALHVRDKETKPCAICGTFFTHISSRANKAKYCSRKCYYKASSMKGKTTYKCTHCGKDFMGHLAHNRKYCSRKCTNKEMKATWKPVFSTVRKAMLSRGMVNACNRCGFDSHPHILGIHHIDRNRHNNSPSNLEVLCPNCHSLEHSKHISHQSSH